MLIICVCFVVCVYLCFCSIQISEEPWEFSDLYDDISERSYAGFGGGEYTICITAGVIISKQTDQYRIRAVCQEIRWFDPIEQYPHFELIQNTISHTHKWTTDITVLRARREYQYIRVNLNQHGMIFYKLRNSMISRIIPIFVRLCRGRSRYCSLSTAFDLHVIVGHQGTLCALSEFPLSDFNIALFLSLNIHR